MTIITKSFPLNADTRIPAVGFGTFLISQDDVAAAVRAAIGVGYRHIDTAVVYANEEGVGEGIRAALKDNNLTREDIFVTTKLWPGFAGWNETPKNREQTRDDFEASLKRLGLDYVDLYLIHSPHGGDQRLEQWKALLDIKSTGQARSIGVSNFNQTHLEEIKAAGLAFPEANQIELHPWSQKPGLVAYMKQNGIAPIAYSSLAPMSTWRAGQESAKTTDMATNSQIFVELAEKYGVSEAQFLLGWGIQNGYAVLPKSLNPERMLQNINFDGLVISEEDMKFIGTLDRGDGIAWSVGDPTQVQ
ncbi:aldo/keto reductase [Salmonella enterica subsp. enterica serovar Bonariensis]|nr:aldo/keto reductase [Salmonella enterica]EBW7040346.1 aldo/keto reductase [Salmonella enterica subsp. enterica serovar Bonariensis]EDT7938711.1 aldo/keto reductase [Salmonella enterica subsp. enterica serovar Aba]EBY0067081.1 aldo/keto reductase [Salmonella enterica subsp. enterica serovar Bonariensis]ECC5707785.1 aldo/keto reductase [Salmonella enterica]